MFRASSLLWSAPCLLLLRSPTPRLHLQFVCAMTSATDPAPAAAAVPESAAADAAAKKEKKAEKERQKLEKAKRLEEKKAKQALQNVNAAAKSKPAKAGDNLPKYVEKTPPGEKKILGPLDSPHHSAYFPAVVESAWEPWWEKSGFYKPEFTADGQNLPAGAFVIPIPPPNVTGALHCGHAIGLALQDLLIRWHRMRGFTTLYVPGCDHASISTQSVVEKMLWRKEQKTRHDLGRKAFLERAVAWKNEYRGKINVALHRMGGSLDWSREAFTMDPSLSQAVMEAFVRLHDDGLIYRANRLVNFSVQLNTSVSNIEVTTKELTGRTMLDVPGYNRKIEFGVLTHFRYPIENPDPGGLTEIEIGTTRLETMLGDVAVAVHPDDARYKSIVGKTIRHPFMPDRRLIIVADKIANPEFGTGAVKITPAHDPNDFEVGVRQKLPFINILNDNGTLNSNAGPFAGQKRYDARYAVEIMLEKLGLMGEKKPNPMSLRLCEKSKDVIEPLMKPQWWVKTRSLADAAIEVVRNGDIKIQPESAEKQYLRWLEGMNDWCISRQLWWGHQIPAWRVDFKGEDKRAESNDNDRWLVALDEEKALKKAKDKFPGKEILLERDPDVLDTWFSSGLWPFSTLGWPHKTHDFENLFPTSVLESGWDIIPFWISRMVMLSLRLTKQIPFKEVYCHSLIRDSQGRKMSKSLGNVLDPVAVIDGITLEQLQEGLKTGNLDPKELEIASKNQKKQFGNGIPDCGADALRFSLVNYTTGGGDINFDVKVMAGFRRFSNKIYQATKYVLGRIPDDYTPPAKVAKTGKETLPERWILHKLNESAARIHLALEDREFSRSSQIVYRYWYNNLCDVFIENSKAIFQDGSPEEKASTIDTLYAALEGGLTMIHPFMPFVSEELWQRLPRRKGDTTPSIMKARYPEFKAELADPISAEEYEILVECSKGLRSLTAEYGIKQGGIGYITATDAKELALLRAELSQVQALAGKTVNSIAIVGPEEQTKELPAGCAVFPVTAATTAYLEVMSHGLDAAALLEKTQARLAKSAEGVEKLRKGMAVDGWAEKVSEAVREAEEDKLAEAEAQMKSLEESIAQFRRLQIT